MFLSHFTFLPSYYYAAFFFLQKKIWKEIKSLKNKVTHSDAENFVQTSMYAWHLGSRITHEISI